MNTDPRKEALDKIQDIANQIPTRYKLAAAVREALRIIEALARHRDNPSCVDPHGVAYYSERIVFFFAARECR